MSEGQPLGDGVFCHGITPQKYRVGSHKRNSEYYWLSGGFATDVNSNAFEFRLRGEFCIVKTLFLKSPCLDFLNLGASTLHKSP